VPEEFAEAYRVAFAKALAEGEHPSGAHAAGVEAVADEIEATGSMPPVPPAAPGPVSGPSARTTVYRAATPLERLRESAAFVPILVAVLALVLVGAAYGVGRAFSEKVDAGSDRAAGSAETSSGPTDAEQSKQPDKDKSGKDEHGKDKPWRGKVEPVRISQVKVSCVLPPSQDAAGRPVAYPASNMLDRDPTTAWRCGGKAIGQRLAVALPQGTEVGQVGLVAGYAKTDPANGVDRYAENNRITRVRWTFPDGSRVVQRLDGSVRHRAMQTIRVPRTEAGTLTLEILAVAPGRRNTTAISTLGVWAAH
jgi:hypothetical protein